MFSFLIILIHTFKPIFSQLQVCRLGNREDMMLLCDRCDQGYHMYCLDPPLEEVPIEDWFCSQCDGTRAVAVTTRQRAPLTLRVRRTVQRNRQIALRDSSVAKKKRKVKGRGKGKRRKKAVAVPSPRKRLAEALGMHDKSSVPAETGSAFSIFGDPNALDVAE